MLSDRLGECGYPSAVRRPGVVRWHPTQLGSWTTGGGSAVDSRRIGRRARLEDSHKRSRVHPEIGGEVAQLERVELVVDCADRFAFIGILAGVDAILNRRTVPAVSRQRFSAPTNGDHHDVQNGVGRHRDRGRCDVGCPSLGRGLGRRGGLRRVPFAVTAGYARTKVVRQPSMAVGLENPIRRAGVGSGRLVMQAGVARTVAPPTARRTAHGRATRCGPRDRRTPSCGDGKRSSPTPSS